MSQRTLTNQQISRIMQDFPGNMEVKVQSYSEVGSDYAEYHNRCPEIEIGGENARFIGREVHLLAEENCQLIEALKGLAAIAHCGGSAGVGEGETMNILRRFTAEYWQKSEGVWETRQRIFKFIEKVGDK